jgi:O-antigen ligase
MKTALILCLILILLAIARTFSRGAMVGSLPTLFFIWLKSKNKFVVLLFLIAVLFIIVVNSPPELIAKYKTIQDPNAGTAGIRRYYWALSIELFKVRPIFGVGACCWANAIWSGLIYLPKTVTNVTPHSVYFQLISELGICGIVTWVVLLFATFKTSSNINGITRFVKENCSDDSKLMDIAIVEVFSNSLTIGLIGGLICGAFLSFLYYSQLYFYIAIMQATLLIALKLSSDLTNNVPMEEAAQHR